MLTIKDCFKTRTIEESSLTLLSKITYQPRKAYTYSTDGENFWEFGRHITNKIHNLKNQIEKQTFEFGPCRKITCKTKLNKIRDIYISTWRDKIIERWLNDCLLIQLHKWFSKQSYAFRVDGVGLDSCIADVTNAIKKSRFFIKRDITQFFYTIDHELMLNKLRTIVDENDYLFKLLSQRIEYRYQTDDKGSIIEKKATIGIPFGSSLAPVLANICLTDLDKEITSKFRVWYFRYSDDFLIAGTNSEETFRAGQYLDKSLSDMKFSLKESHKQNISFCQDPNFESTKHLKHLGIEFNINGTTRLSIEKQRKIINFYKRAFKREKKRLNNGKLDNRLQFAIEIANNVVKERIRSAAIVDYYLKHVDDELQLKNMDRIILEMLISTMLNKKFRPSDFQTISPGKLRELGLISLVHRNRLHRHGHLKINFLSMYSDKVVARHDAAMCRRKERIDQIRLAKKLRKMKTSCR